MVHTNGTPATVFLCATMVTAAITPESRST
jgi:hypothetical protein